MSVRILAADTHAQRAEEIMQGLTDGIVHVIAVEVYDAPGVRIATKADAARHDTDEGSPIGIWVVGPSEAVYDALAEHGWEDYTLQYEAGFEGDKLPED